jgi:hypothetical protein
VQTVDARNGSTATTDETSTGTTARPISSVPTSEPLTASTAGYAAGSSRSGAGSVYLAALEEETGVNDTCNATAGSITWSQYLAARTLSSAGSDEEVLSAASSVAGSQLPPDLTDFSPNTTRATTAANSSASSPGSSKRSAETPYPASTSEDESKKPRFDITPPSTKSDWKIVVRKRDQTWGRPTALARKSTHFEIEDLHPSDVRHGKLASFFYNY